MRCCPAVWRRGSPSTGRARRWSRSTSWPCSKTNGRHQPGGRSRCWPAEHPQHSSMTSPLTAADLLDLGSSRRCVTPERTVDRALACFGTVGITRLAEITGLDRIGIPVWLALRPNARSLSGGQGKGVTDAAARASAVMETIETWHAERVAPGELASFAALGRGKALDPLELDPGPDLGGWDVDQPLRWLVGEDLLGGPDVFVPRQAMDLDLTELSSPRFLAGSTNGLASGNQYQEALVHGLYELIERDA